MNAHLEQRIERYGAPPETAAKVAIVVHGRDQRPEWMREWLIDRLDAPDVAFVAPEAADNTWYPCLFTHEVAANEPHLTWALDRLDAIVAELERAGRTRDELFLVGFSQGACVVAEYLCRHPGRYGGAAILTGGLIGPPGTSWDGASFEGTPIVVATSDADEWVPIERAARTRDVFESRDADVTWRVDHGLDHVIDDDQVRLVEALLAGRLAAAHGDARADSSPSNGREQE